MNDNLGNFSFNLPNLPSNRSMNNSGVRFNNNPSETDGGLKNKFK